MKVTVVDCECNPPQFKVAIRQGTQLFHLDYKGTQVDCHWIAKMFRKALKAHDAPLQKKYDDLKFRMDGLEK